MTYVSCMCNLCVSWVRPMCDRCVTLQIVQLFKVKDWIDFLLQLKMRKSSYPPMWPNSPTHRPGDTSTILILIIQFYINKSAWLFGILSTFEYKSTNDKVEVNLNFVQNYNSNKFQLYFMGYKKTWKKLSKNISSHIWLTYKLSWKSYLTVDQGYS